MIQISMSELNQRLSQMDSTRVDGGELVLDVREPEEFDAGHVPGSVNIPVDEVLNRVSDLKGFRTIYIYCRSGRRAQHVHDELVHAGFANLVCIARGGMPDWELAGLPVEK